jgi:hypothetical protein
MSTPLLIGDEQRAELCALRERANAAPVDVRTLVERIATPAGREQHRDHMTAQTVAIPMAYLVTFSVEIGHPIGTCRHLSMSVQREGRVPNEYAVWMVAEALGFVGGLELCTCWLEDLEGHGKAVNVVQPVAIMEPAP